MRRIGYADPPYIGCARAHYSDDPNCAEVDHDQLVGFMLCNFDSWALSCHVPSLKTILDILEGYSLIEGTNYRICAWVKPFAVFKPNVDLAYAWEPVIVYNRLKATRDEPTVRDWVSANITLQRGVHGAKPEGFNNWLFDVLNIQPDDVFVDLFPGSGAVTSSLINFKSQTKLSVEEC